MQGDLAEGLLPGLLRKLYVERLSAVLELRRGVVRRAFLFRSGQLVGLDGLTPEAGDDVVRIHVREAIDDCLAWKDGTFALLEADPKAPPLSTASLKLPTGDLILDTARRAGRRAIDLGLGDTSRLVQLSTDPMLRFQRLSLTPEDGYVVSRVDGTFSADELLELTTLDRDALRCSLYALLCTGVVEYVPGTGQRKAPSAPPVAPPAPAPPPPAPPPPPPAPAPAAAPPPRPSVPPTPARPTVVARPSVPRAAAGPPPPVSVKTSWTPPGKDAAPPAPAPAEDSARERRAEIEAVHAALKGQNHFQVLGLERTATGAEVKDSYFKRARRFHPDVLAHDPELADLREKLEAVFIRLGEAYEILKSPRARASYEDNLAMHEPPPPPPAPAPGTPEPAPEAPRGPSLEELARITAEVRKGEKMVTEERWWDAIEFLEPLVYELKGRLKSRAQVALARAYAHNPKWARRSEKLLIGVLDDDPKYVDAHLALGRVYLKSGMKARALSTYRRALELEPDHEELLAAVATLAPPEAAEPEDDRSPEGGGLIRKLFKKS